MVGQSLGRYRVLEEIGSGGMGVVYRARDEKLERDVALKVLPKDRLGDETARRRFHKEAKSLSKLNHPNIATVHDFGTEEGVDYLVMEYITGENLEEKLERGALDGNEVLRLGMQLAEGLSAAHGEGVVHRDLKPGNLRITPEGRLKILDLGLALLLQAPNETATTDSRLTDAQAAVGTLPYMAPEQLRGELADERTDIYAAGAVLYEMATGQRPFPEKSGALLISAILTQWPATPREVNGDISTALEKVILKALDKQRDRRYPSAQELLGELQKLGSGVVAAVAPSPPFLERARELARVERPVFVAREEELEKLEHFLDQALSGQGRVVFVTGEAGAGKTSLVDEFVRRSQKAHEDLIVASGKCNANTGTSDPYLPFREVLGLLTGEVESRYRAGAISSEHATRLWHCLPVSIQSLVESGPDLIDTFVGGRPLVARAESYVVGRSEWLSELRAIVERKATLPTDPSLQQSVLFKQYTSILESLARWKPVLLMLDDLQWTDRGSMGLLMHLLDRIQDLRVLVVGIHRLEEVARGRDGEDHVLKAVVNGCKQKFGDIQIEVGTKGSREFVEAYLDTEPNRFSSGFREAFLRHTEGHSLFTTEVFRSLQGQGALVRDDEGRWVDGEVDWKELPTRVEAMIGQRIDRLPEHLREALVVGSVEGEFFTGEVLAAVQKADEREMVRLLSGELDKRHHLVSAQGIRHEGGRRRSQYRFRHILFQKYLYNSMDEVERAYLHEDVGTALEKLYGEQAEDIAVQLARHFQEAGITEKAISYLKKAGQRAVRLSANEEAIKYFNKALELLGTLPETKERAHQELALQLSLVAPLIAVKGYATPEILSATHRARALCETVGDRPQILPVLFFLATFHAIRAENDVQFELAKQQLAIAESTGDPLSIAISHWMLGTSHLCSGNFNKLVEHNQWMIDFYDPKEHGSLGLFYGQDPGASSLTWIAFGLWFLGYPDKALERSRKALALAAELKHPFTLFFVQANAGAWFHRCRRELREHKEWTDQYIRLGNAEGFGLAQVYKEFDLGCMLVDEGRFEEGIHQMRSAPAALDAVGFVFARTYMLSALAEACGKAGKLEEAMAEIAKAQAQVEKTGEGFYEAEVHRVKGELLEIQGHHEEAEAAFQQAVDIAQRRQAKIWELRAVTSLARLWQKQGKKEEARSSLAEVYSWFTEGFDTPDLKDAKALLDELS